MSSGGLPVWVSVTGDVSVEEEDAVMVAFVVSLSSGLSASSISVEKAMLAVLANELRAPELERSNWPERKPEVLEAEMEQ